MQATAPQATAAATGGLAAKQTLTIFAVDLAAVLMPVLTVLRRRQCRITMVSFDEGGPQASGHLRIEVEPPPKHAHCVAAWVANVVGVDGIEICGMSGDRRGGETGADASRERNRVVTHARTCSGE